MKILKSIILFCSLISAIFAQEKITEAFGQKLGGDFDPSSAIGKTALTDGTPMYEFSPSKTFRSFKRYYVMITPTTHKIYSIWAIGTFENTATAKKEQALLMELLIQKYGEEKKEGIFDAMSDVKRIDKGDRDILLKISGFTDVTLDIRYYDRPLEKLAEKERLAIEAKKVDASAL